MRVQRDKSGHLVGVQASAWVPCPLEAENIGGVARVGEVELNWTDCLKCLWDTEVEKAS